MAQRKGQRAVKAQPRAKAPGMTVSRADQRSGEDWRQECDRLKTELEVARREIAALRTRQEHVLNHIDWVLDSLDSLSQTES